MTDGVLRYLPTSPEHMEILEERAKQQEKMEEKKVEGSLKYPR